MRAINWEDPAHHRHTQYLQHHLIPLTASKGNGTATATIKVGDKSIDVNDDFWVVLYAHAPNVQHAWNLKYHVEPDQRAGGIRNTERWHVKTGSGTAGSEPVRCDVHLAHAEEGLLVHGIELDVLVEYIYEDLAYSDIEVERNYSFGQIDSLPRFKRNVIFRTKFAFCQFPTAKHNRHD